MSEEGGRGLIEMVGEGRRLGYRVKREMERGERDSRGKEEKGIWSEEGGREGRKT